MTPISNSQVQRSARVDEVEDLLKLLDHVAHLPPEVRTPEELAACERQTRGEADRSVGLILGEIMQAPLSGAARAR